MALDPLGHIRIAVSDFEESREFYHAFFEQHKVLQNIQVVVYFLQFNSSKKNKEIAL